MVRVISSSTYPNSQPISAAFTSLISLLAVGNHRFVADSCSLLGATVDHTRVLGPRQITDTYLLALAGSTDRQLASFDHRMSTAAVARGDELLHRIT